MYKNQRERTGLIDIYSSCFDKKKREYRLLSRNYYDATKSRYFYDNCR